MSTALQIPPAYVVLRMIEDASDENYTVTLHEISKTARVIATRLPNRAKRHTFCRRGVSTQLFMGNDCVNHRQEVLSEVAATNAGIQRGVHAAINLYSTYYK